MALPKWKISTCKPIPESRIREQINCRRLEYTAKSIWIAKNEPNFWNLSPRKRVRNQLENYLLTYPPSFPLFYFSWLTCLSRYLLLKWIWIMKANVFLMSSVVWLSLITNPPPPTFHITFSAFKCQKLLVNWMIVGATKCGKLVSGAS